MTYVFLPGRSNAAVCCQMCGFKRHANQIRKQWNGLRVCKECWEARNVQEFVQGVPDKQQVPGGALPEPADTFIDPTFITPDML